MSRTRVRQYQHLPRQGRARGLAARPTQDSEGTGRDRLLYRAYEEGQGFVGETPQRPLMLDRLRWEDGWPLLPDRTPGQEAHVPRIE